MRTKAAADPDLKGALLDEAANQLKYGEIETSFALRGLAGVLMRPSVALELHRSVIREIVERHKCRNPRVFGSIVRGEDTEESNLDLIVETDGASLIELARIEYEIAEIVGVRAIIHTPRNYPPEERERILAEAQPV